jgi:hypothetical protein
MERRGLDLWKDDMKRLLKSVSTHERDFATRDKLDMLSEAVRNFMERAFTLELAVWSASISGYDGGGSPSSMENSLDRNDVLSSTSAEDATSYDMGAYRVDRRIKCGCDVIVRDVIPFLECDPVDETMRKIVDSYAPRNF